MGMQRVGKLLLHPPRQIISSPEVKGWGCERAKSANMTNGTLVRQHWISSESPLTELRGDSISRHVSHQKPRERERGEERGGEERDRGRGPPSSYCRPRTNARLTGNRNRAGHRCGYLGPMGGVRVRGATEEGGRERVKMKAIGGKSARFCRIKEVGSFLTSSYCSNMKVHSDLVYSNF